MEVNVTPELEKRLSDFAAQSGLSPDEVVEDALSGYFEDLAETRAMLDRRYDEIESGKVTLIPGEEAFARLRANIEARRGST